MIINNKLSKIYYSPKGYWKGIAAIKRLTEAAKVSEDAAREWLKKQAIWQIYLPAPNEVHQTDLLNGSLGCLLLYRL